MAKILGDDIDYRQFLANQQADYVRPASSFAEDVEELALLGPSAYGDTLPWERTHSDIRLRPGEVTLWAGINKHGKSLVAGQTILWLLLERRGLIASMEMAPRATLWRMMKQAAGMESPPMRYRKDWMAWTDGKLWIYDQMGSVEIESILGMVYYAAGELSIDHILIDSLMKCGIAPDDYTKQKAFVDQLCWAAKTTDTHIHLVHHVRKGRKEAEEPDKFDIRGAGEIADLVDNIFLVHRNKGKEDKVRRGLEVDVGSPDLRLIVAGQRHGTGWEGSIPLYWDAPSQQYTQAPRRGPMKWG